MSTRSIACTVEMNDGTPEFEGGVLEEVLAEIMITIHITKQCVYPSFWFGLEWAEPFWVLGSL